jgi:hypothetical protein
LFFDLTGEVIWVMLYVALGRIFSDRVQALSALLGNVVWVIVGLVAMVVLGWKLVQPVRTASLRRAETQAMPPRTNHSSITERSQPVE